MTQKPKEGGTYGVEEWSGKEKVDGRGREAKKKIVIEERSHKSDAIMSFCQ